MISARQAYQMLGNESVWKVSEKCAAIFDSAQIPFALCGGLAVCLHGYQRNTIDLDFIIRPIDTERTRAELIAHGFAWDPEECEFRTTDGIPVYFLISGNKAGKDIEVAIAAPEGDQNVETREGLRVLRLSRLIEMKLASGMGNLRRTHKDFADVVELIDVRSLDGSFARFLHQAVRQTFRELVRHARES